MLRNLWRFWYQVPIALPVVGPVLIGDPKARFGRAVVAWVGAGFTPADDDAELYLERMRAPGHAVAVRGGTAPSGAAKCSAGCVANTPTRGSTCPCGGYPEPVTR
jgi:hypothetical protein